MDLLPLLKGNVDSGELRLVFSQIIKQIWKDLFSRSVLNIESQVIFHTI
jgi:hypothetical protein